uniref:Leucine rich repeat containing 38 n=1 Tax=Sarcophilus harrisii TaxID=9305 RepID=A0A7N4NGX0_SARHA
MGPPPGSPPSLLPAAALCLLSCLLSAPRGHACPAGCVCADSHTVDCRARGLPSVPSAFPLDVRKLLVADNRIEAIPADFFIFYGDLVYLDFRNNSLSSLQEGAFSGSAKLIFLDLSYNNLTELAAGTFRSAGKLLKLSLANNRLAGVDEAAFESLESLQVLELNDNDLRSLNVAALAALPSLRTLRLDGNPWLCDCGFAQLFSWLQDNASKLPKVSSRVKSTDTLLSSVSEGKRIHSARCSVTLIHPNGDISPPVMRKVAERGDIQDLSWQHNHKTRSDLFILGGSS